MSIIIFILHKFFSFFYKCTMFLIWIIVFYSFLWSFKFLLMIFLILFHFFPYSLVFSNDIRFSILLFFGCFLFGLLFFHLSLFGNFSLLSFLIFFFLLFFPHSFFFFLIILLFFLFFFHLSFLFLFLHFFLLSLHFLCLSLCFFFSCTIIPIIFLAEDFTDIWSRINTTSCCSE